MIQTFQKACGLDKEDQVRPYTPPSPKNFSEGPARFFAIIMAMIGAEQIIYGVCLSVISSGTRFLYTQSIVEKYKNKYPDLYSVLQRNKYNHSRVTEVEENDTNTYQLNKNLVEMIAPMVIGGLGIIVIALGVSSGNDKLVTNTSIITAWHLVESTYKTVKYIRSSKLP